MIASEEQCAEMVRELVCRAHIVAEGAAASTVAAAVRNAQPGENIVCVLSGGCMDAMLFSKLLLGEI